MRRRLWFAAAAGLLTALVIALPVAAGGWATLIPDADAPPSEGGTTVIGFTLMQHGVTPVDFGEATVIASNVESGAIVRAQAGPQPGTDGHWSARLSLPPGQWTYVVTHTDLEIQAPANLSLLSTAPGSAVVPPPASNTPLALLLIGGVMAMSLAALGVVLLYQRRQEVPVKP